MPQLHSTLSVGLFTTGSPSDFVNLNHNNFTARAVIQRVLDKTHKKPTQFLKSQLFPTLHTTFRMASVAKLGKNQIFSKPFHDEYLVPLQPFKQLHEGIMHKRGRFRDCSK